MKPSSRPITLGVSFLCVFLLILGSVPRSSISAQSPPPPSLQPVVGQAVAYAVSTPVRNLLPDEAAIKPDDPDENMKVIPNRTIREEATQTGSVDPVVQSSGPQILSTPATNLQFEGVSNQDNFNSFGFRVSPPDTDGDVGPNHYVQQVNLLVRIWDKSGNPLTAPFRLSSLFAPIGGQCAAPDAGDPIVLYDPLADRWLLSQFAFASSTAPPYFQCIAISQTPDPTGAYFLYAFQTPGNEFPDYPKLGVWPDGYYMTVNQFTNGGPFNGTGAYAFNRAKMLAGDPTANFIYFNLNLATHPEAIGGALPSDLDGLTPPPAGAPNVFAYFLATEFGDALDALRLFDFHADFANPANSTFTERADSPIPVAAFNPLTPAGRDDISQPPPSNPTTAALDAIADRLMHRMAYRNFGTHESWVTNHTVNVTGGTTVATFRAGVRYYELRRSGGPLSVHEQATFSPDTHSRWMGSAAIDNSGNLCVGYSIASLTVFPGIRYACREAGDPPGGLFQGETTLIGGTGVQTSTGSRWGDYSALAVDPSDECTFWYTNEYYTAASQASSTVGWLTRVGSFRLSSCTSPTLGTLQGTVTNSMTAAPIAGATVEVSGGFVRTTDASGNYSLDLPPGNYTVTASKFGFSSASANVTIVGNATTVQNLALTPVAVVVGDSAAITAEGFSPPNGTIDPAETVTVDFTLRNIGAGATMNLVATLQPTGGVLNPSGPQNYGVIPGAGGTGTRPFTFRADPSIACGGMLTATLHLQDGANNLGNVTFKFMLGNTIVALAENFDGVTVPDLPAGWTAVNASGPAPLWTTSNSGTPAPAADSAPNAAFVNDPAVVSDKRLTSPSFMIQSTAARLSFRNNYNMEAGFDGGVLEISLDGGAFTDILAAGGSFVSGGYNRTLSTNASFMNPLVGRMAWSANSGGFINTVVSLPASAAGKMVQLRWRMGSDNTVAGVGWRIDNISVTDGVSCSFNIMAAGSAITAESFIPNNGEIDPGEKVMVNFTLKNTGSKDTTNLVATLLPTGGVTSPSGAGNYGVIAGGGGTGTQSYMFTADSSLACGDTLTATLQLSEAGVDLGTVKFNFVLGALDVMMPLTENFDGVTAPDLPAGWTATNAAGPAPLWVTTSATPDTPPNTAFVDDPSVVSDKRLDSTPFFIEGNMARLTFRHNNILENNFDGGVLEISFDGGPFMDIVAAGGSFVQGGYNGTISTSFMNPIGGRMAWTGNSNGYRTTIVNLPTSAAGKIVQLRWRMGSDNSVSSTGWRVDTISVTDPVRRCTESCIVGGSASPNVLSPPNHRLVDVQINYTLRSSCSATCSLSVGSNEPVNGLGDGDTAPDWFVIGPNHVRLRAERSGTGNGRIYTTRITCTDASANQEFRDVLIRVPHDRR